MELLSKQNNLFYQGFAPTVQFFLNFVTCQNIMTHQPQKRLTLFWKKMKLFYFIFRTFIIFLEK